MHPKATAGLAVAQAMNLSPGLPSHHSLLEGCLDLINQTLGSSVFFLFHLLLSRIFRDAERTPHWGAAVLANARASAPPRTLEFLRGE